MEPIQATLRDQERAYKMYMYTVSKNQLDTKKKYSTIHTYVSRTLCKMESIHSSRSTTGIKKIFNLATKSLNLIFTVHPQLFMMQSAVSNILVF